MISARRYRPTNTRFFTWLVRNTYGAWIRRAYNVADEGLKFVKTIEPPYIVVGNHSTLLDPFLANALMPRPIHWVASDGNMRNPLMRFLLIKLAGAIPKSKAIPDIETVNWIVEFIRKRKGVVGFYPEGQASWNGSSIPSFGATAKLLKLLKVPVVLVLTKGAYMTKPRWAYTRRAGKVEIGFSLLFDPATLKNLSVGEIAGRLDAALAHDDPAWAKDRRINYSGSRRAECLELAFYACPVCGALQSLESSGSTVSCKACGATAEYGEDGSFGSPFPAGLKVWDDWQEAHLRNLLVEHYLPNPSLPIFFDEGVVLFSGKRMNTMLRLGVGTLVLKAQGLEFTPRLGRKLAFSLGDIEGPGVLKWNYFEFYAGKKVYRARFRDRTSSGRKYAVALDILTALRDGAAHP
jgi:1-acyl-sn-glycerol-3-phosphate acyltransferase